MNFIDSILKNGMVLKIGGSLLSIILGIIVYRYFIGMLERKIERSKATSALAKKGKTYFKLLKSIMRYILIIIVVIVILKIFGINISSMLAGVGIIGIIIGFAIQDALKDIIKGFDIISDSYYNVGDVIKYKDITGKVLAIGLKTTRVQDIYTLNIVSISNRNIEQVEIVSNLLIIDIPIPYEVDVETAEKAIFEIMEEIKKNLKINECSYRGINEFADSSIIYQIKIDCDPLNKLKIRREALRYVLVGLTNNKISIPYMQIDIHKK